MLISHNCPENQIALHWFFWSPTCPLCSLLCQAGNDPWLPYVCSHIYNACGSFDKDLFSQFGRVAAYILDIRRTHVGFQRLRNSAKSGLVASGWNFKAFTLLRYREVPKEGGTLKWLKERGTQNTRSGIWPVPMRWCKFSKCCDFNSA